jgi:hypothetical protein
MKPVLDPKWVSSIFKRLIGIYGVQFKNKFSAMEDGVDSGMVTAMEVWGQELGVFASRPEAIAFALDNLPTDHAPNAIEFKSICSRAPRKEVPMLPPPDVVSDPVMLEKLAQRVAAVVAGPKDFLGWAKSPRSQIALDSVVSLAKTDHRFREILSDLVEAGTVSKEGKLLMGAV